MSKVTQAEHSLLGNPSVFVGRAAGEQESVPIFRTCLEKNIGQDFSFLSSTRFSGNSLMIMSILRRKKECFISIADENVHCLAFLLQQQNLGVCQAGPQSYRQCGLVKMQHTEVRAAGLPPSLYSSSAGWL